MIENHPLQTYSSALLFSPTRTLTRQLFKREEPDWITTKPAMEAEWGACVQTLEGYRNGVASVAFSPRGTHIASGSDDSTVKIWDSSSGACFTTLEGHGGIVTSVAFSPSGTVVVSGSGDNTVKIWDARSGACLNTLEGHHNKDTSIALSPSGAHIASGSYDKTLRSGMHLGC